MYLDKLVLSTITIVNIIIAKYFLIRIRKTLHIFTIASRKINYYEKEEYRDDELRWEIVNKN